MFDDFFQSEIRYLLRPDEETVIFFGGDDGKEVVFWRTRSDQAPLCERLL